jgi:formylglycine-generating enzyme required for sulfatase activity
MTNLSEAYRPKSAGQFGQTLKRLLQERALSQSEFSRRSGLGPSYVSKLVNGRISEPRRESITAIAGALGLSEAELWSTVTFKEPTALQTVSIESTIDHFAKFLIPEVKLIFRDNADPFGQAIKRLLKERGLSQREFSKQSGLDPSYVSKLVNGNIAKPRRAIVTAIAGALDLSEAELWSAVTFEEPMALKTISVESTVHTYTEIFSPGVEVEMALIMGGEFRMGSPEDEENRRSNEFLHSVTVPTFFMARTLITQAQWRSIAKLPKIKTQLKSNPSNFKDSDDLPVEQVSWNEAIEFCLRLSKKTGHTYRLPSEAEWEYACRAGTTTPFHFGETIDASLANYRGNSTYGKGVEGPNQGKTTPVKTFPPNPWGLYDMHGNVWEWCQDDYKSDHSLYPSDGKPYLAESQKKGASKVLRGGSWFNYPQNCRSAYRYNYTRANHYGLIGFRLVCSASKALP